MFEYERESAYSSKPLVNRFKGWRQVPQAMVAYAEREGQDEWADVLEIAKAAGKGTVGGELNLHLDQWAARNGKASD